jgi:DUF1009 family protein
MTVSQLLNVSALIAAMERFTVPERVMMTVVEAVEKRPNIPLDDVIALLKALGIHTLTTHRVKSAMLASVGDVSPTL